MDGISSLSPPQERKTDKQHQSPPSVARHKSHETSQSSRISYSSRSPPLGRLQEVDSFEEDGTNVVSGVSSSHSPVLQLRRRSSSGVYSPLMVSTDASTVLHKRKKNGKTESTPETKALQNRPLSQESQTSTDLNVSEGDKDEKRRSLRDERARRQLFALSAEGKVGSRESAYMGWASLPQVGQMKQRWEKEAGEGVRKRVENLLSPPQLTGDQVPFEFRGLQPYQPGRLSVWKQKVIVCFTYNIQYMMYVVK